MGGGQQVTIHKNIGPWVNEIKKSKLNKTFFLEDRSLEYKYFYTEAEKKRVGYLKSKKTTEKEVYNTSEGDKFTDIRQIRYSLHLHNKY